MSRIQQTYQLIKALTRGEKRAFNLFISKYSKDGKSNIHVLFDIYDSVNVWNEDLIKTKINKSKIKKYYSVVNNKLLESLVTNLRTQDGESNVDFVINRYIEEAKILFQREIFDLALDKIKKARKKAEDAEKHIKLLEILNVEKSIKLRITGNEVFKEFNTASYIEKAKILKIIENQEEYRKLTDKIFFTYRMVGTPKNELEDNKYEEIINHELLKDSSQAISTSAKSSFYFIHSIYYLGKGELRRAADIITEQVRVLSKTDFLLKANVDQYVSVLNNSLYVYSKLKDKEKLFETFYEIRNLATKFGISSTYFERRVFETTYSMELDYYIQNKEIENANDLIPAITKGLVHYGKSGWSLDRFIGIAFGIALVYYYQKKYELSHEWLDKILDRENEKANIQVISYAKLLDLILHYNYKNYSLLLYRVKNVKRFLSKYNKLSEFDDRFLKLLLQLSENKLNKEILIKEYRSYINNCPDAAVKDFYFNYLEIDKWLDSI